MIQENNHNWAQHCDPFKDIMKTILTLITDNTNRETSKLEDMIKEIKQYFQQKNIEANC